MRFVGVMSGESLPQVGGNVCIRETRNERVRANKLVVDVT
jgi:hypothetical protein